MSIVGARQSFQMLDSASASFGESQTSGLVAGQYTQPFSIVPFLKPYVLGVWLQLVGTVTATGAASPVAGTDSIDLWFNELEVSAAVGGETLSDALTRQFAEFAWVWSTDVNPNVAAAPTFASAGAGVVTTYLYVPLGGAAASVKLKLPSAITGVYASNATFAYTSVTTYIVSTSWSGVIRFSEQNTASLGTAGASLLNYLPGAVAPDAIFMKGESSTTITQVTLITVNNVVLAQTTATAINQLGAAGICNTAGTTYTTSAGFVLMGNGQAFRTFQVWFSSATTHFVGYTQCAGGEDTMVSLAPGMTKAPPAAGVQGSVTAAGDVASQRGGSGGSAGIGGTLTGGLMNTGSSGSIISLRK